jgi:hypothetical protein
MDAGRNVHKELRHKRSPRPQPHPLFRSSLAHVRPYPCSRVIIISSIIKTNDMDKNRYDYQISGNNLDFHFVSEGPKGKIAKLIRYSPDNENGITYFNLAFGDYDLLTGILDDSNRSNNHDLEKILATIASSVLEFTSNFPDALVYAEGSTEARTRLYQMAISANLDQIKEYLQIFGLRNEVWEPFQQNISYSAFLVRRK